MGDFYGGNLYERFEGAILGSDFSGRYRGAIWVSDMGERFWWATSMVDTCMSDLGKRIE